MSLLSVFCYEKAFKSPPSKISMNQRSFQEKYLLLSGNEKTLSKSPLVEAKILRRLSNFQINHVKKIKHIMQITQIYV